jgi:O-antigen/teichoic acid export membrane protein
MLQPLLLNVIGLPAAMYIIRNLGPTAYGQWAVAGSLVATFGFLANMGLRMWFVREVSQYPDRLPAALAEVLGLRLLLALLAAGVSLTVCYALGYPAVVLQCTALSCVAMLLVVFGSAIADVLQSLQRLPAMSAVNLASGLILTVASVAAVWLGWGPVGVAGAYALGPLTAAILFTFMVYRLGLSLRMDLNVARFAELLIQVRSMGAQVLALNLATRAEALLVPKLVGVTQYGLFSAATMLGVRLEVIPDGLSAAYYPVIAALYRADPKAASREVAQYLLFTLLLSVPCVVIVSFLAAPISAVLFSDPVGACADVMRISIWSLPLLGAAYVMGYSLNAAGKETIAARCAISANVCSAALSVVLIWRFGLAGAAWSCVARDGIGVLFRCPWFIQTFVTTRFRLPIVRIVIAGALMAALLWMLERTESMASLARVHSLPSILHLLMTMGIKVGVAVLVYAAAVIILRVLRRSDLQSILNRRPLASSE